MYTVVKFFANYDRKSQNPLITHSLLKIGFIKKGIPHTVEHDEFWTVRILKETSPGRAQGCFLLEPIQKIEKSDILRLLPNTFSIRENNGILYISPMKRKDGYWIVPLIQRKMLAAEYKAYGLVVEHQQEPVEDAEIHGV